MNHWQETTELLARLAALMAEGRRAALATVVRVTGSAYRRPGARLLVEEGGASAGGVSGGCLEADVREVARGVLAGAPARLLTYDTSAGDEEVFGLGLGCRGRVEVFVQPASEGPLAALLPAWRAAVDGDAPFALATVIAGADGLGGMLLLAPDGTLHASAPPGDPERSPSHPEHPPRHPERSEGFPPPDPPAQPATSGGTSEGDARSGAGAAMGSADGFAAAAARALAAGRSGCEEVAGHMLFLETLQPPPHLLVAGAGDDAVPLAALAAEAGFRVTVVDHRPLLVTPERFPRAARCLLARPGDPDARLPPAERTLAVVMTHSFGNDRDWARRLVAHGVPHVGLLGPRVRAGEIRAALGLPESDPRLFGPVGLDVGADGPRQVAISIVAELLAIVTARTPGRLCDRVEAIHAG